MPGYNQPTLQFPPFLSTAVRNDGGSNLLGGFIEEKTINADGSVDNYKYVGDTQEYLDWAASSDLQSSGGSDVDPSTLGRNLFGSHYIGPWNPKTYGGDWDYSVAPKNAADRNGFIHDKAYDKLRIVGARGLFLSKQAIPADKRFVSSQMSIMMNAGYPMDVRFQAGVSGIFLGAAATPKITVYGTQDAVKEVGYGYQGFINNMIGAWLRGYR